MAAYSMPFHMRDVAGSYPSAQLAAVDRDSQIFRYGQIFENTRNPNKRLVAARTLSQVSPGFQEAQIEKLAGDNFSQKQLESLKRENMALQKQYIQDRTAAMEQKTANRLLRQNLVSSLSTARTSGSRTPMADLDLDEQFEIGYSQPPSGAQSPSMRITQEQVAALEGGLSSSFWGSQSGSSYPGSEMSFEQEESRYGLGVEPIALNIDPARLQRIEIARAQQLEDRTREQVIGGLVSEMVHYTAQGEAYEQERERRNRLYDLLGDVSAAGIEIETANPSEMTENEIRQVARTIAGAQKKGFFGRSEMAAMETFQQSPLEIESAEMEQEPGGQSLQSILATQDEFGSRGSLALAGGAAVAKRRGRPVGYVPSQETRAKISESMLARSQLMASRLRGPEREAFIESQGLSRTKAGRKALKKATEGTPFREVLSSSSSEAGGQFSLFD